MEYEEVNEKPDTDPRLHAIPDIHGHAKGEHKAFSDERPIPLSARMLFLWFYHACRRGWPRFMMVTDHMNYLTFEDPAAINLVRRALKLAQAGDLYGAAETASVEVGHAAVVSEGLRRGMRYSIGAEVDNDPRSRPDAQNIVDAMKPDGMIRSVHFLAIDHPTHGPNWNWPFDNPEFADVYDIIGTAKTWELYMTTLLDAVERLPGNIVGHFYVPALFGHWPDDATLEGYEDRIVDACEARGMAIEFNTRFLYREHSDEEKAKYLAAHRRLLGKCKAKNVGIAIGSDAHSPKDQAGGFDEVLAVLDACDINELVFPIGGRLARVALRVERKVEPVSEPAAVDERKSARKARPTPSAADGAVNETTAADEPGDKPKARPKRSKPKAGDVEIDAQNPVPSSAATPASPPISILTDADVIAETITDEVTDVPFESILSEGAGRMAADVASSESLDEIVVATEAPEIVDVASEREPAERPDRSDTPPSEAGPRRTVPKRRAASRRPAPGHAAPSNGAADVPVVEPSIDLTAESAPPAETGPTLESAPAAEVSSGDDSSPPAESVPADVVARATPALAAPGADSEGTDAVAAAPPSAPAGQSPLADTSVEVDLRAPAPADDVTAESADIPEPSVAVADPGPAETPAAFADAADQPRAAALEGVATAAHAADVESAPAAPNAGGERSAAEPANGAIATHATVGDDGAPAVAGEDERAKTPLKTRVKMDAKPRASGKHKASASAATAGLKKTVAKSATKTTEPAATKKVATKKVGTSKKNTAAKKAAPKKASAKKVAPAKKAAVRGTSAKKSAAKKTAAKKSAPKKPAQRRR